MPSMVLLQLLFGTWIAQGIYVAASLGIADLLKDGSKSIDELAQLTNTHPKNLYRVLRALASVNIFTEVAPRQFSLTTMAKYLQSDFSNSLRSLAMMLGDEWHWRCWGDILNIVQSGQPGLAHLYNVDDTFKYFEQNPASGKLFNDAMTNFSKNVHTAVIDAYDFSHISKIVDVGGGYGTLITSILAANSQTNGILFDLPNVADSAKKLIKQHEVSKRCEVISGNFFHSVPSGGDAYILSYIIHDWDDDRCIQILRNIRQSIAADGKLLLVEGVVPDGNKPHLSKLMDLEMMIFYPSGQERTEDEYSQLYKAAGFRLNRIIPTAAPVSIIEGVCV
ncbi:methyltransferase [Calothrix sp. FACHB-1219]